MRRLILHLTWFPVRDRENNDDPDSIASTVPYFLFSGIIQAGCPFQMSGEEAGHILKSRRIQTGEVVHVQDAAMIRYEARVESADNRKLTLLPLQTMPTPDESSLKIHLRQALVKEKALDAIIQKSTELGVSSIQVFHSQYSQRLHTRAEHEKKTQRWARIAVEACKQSGRTQPPDICFIPDWLKFNQVSGESSTETVPLICLESSPDAISLQDAYDGSHEVILMVGPEGGWGVNELSGIPLRRVFLGPRILRSETAVMAGISILQYLYGDLNQPCTG